MRAQALADFVNERERIRLKKESGAPAPWTKNGILSKFRFCNARREDDKVTRWIADNWCTPHIGHPNMTVAMLLARMVNWPPTLQHLGFPKVWDDAAMERMVEKLQELRGKVWSGAYIVSTCGARMDKATYVVQNVCGTAHARGIVPGPGDSLDSFWRRLCAVPGLGAGFIAAQVVADLKYCDKHLSSAQDWWSWAVPGPGSKRGLARVFEYDTNRSWNTEDWQSHLAALISEVQPLVLDVFQGEQLHAQDWQNCLCEFDKYERTRNGEGTPRSIYRPSADF